MWLHLFSTFLLHSLTGWFLYRHFVRVARPATTTTMEGKITFGYPNRTTAVTAVEVIKAQNSAATFSGRPICFYKWAFLSLLWFVSDGARDRRTQARAAFSSISLVARVTGDESHCMQYRIGWLIWFDPVASLKSWDIFNLPAGSGRTAACMFFRRGKEKSDVAPQVDCCGVWSKVLLVHLSELPSTAF